MQVFLFTQPTCPQCPAAKEAVNCVCNEKNVEVKEINVKTDEGLMDAIKYNILSTPTAIVIEGNKVVKAIRGYVSKGELEACLA